MDVCFICFAQQKSSHVKPQKHNAEVRRKAENSNTNKKLFVVLCVFAPLRCSYLCILCGFV